jgi:hypothetical protein
MKLLACLLMTVSMSSAVFAGDTPFAKRFNDGHAYDVRGNWFDDEGRTGSYSATVQFVADEKQENQVLYTQKIVARDDKGEEIMTQTVAYTLVGTGHGFFDVANSSGRIGSGYCTFSDECHYGVRLGEGEAAVMMEETLTFGRLNRLNMIGSARAPEGPNKMRVAYSGQGK